MDVETFLRQQRETNSSELRNIGGGSDLAARALRLPFEAREAIMSWLVQNQVQDDGALERTLQAISEGQEAVPNIAEKIAAREAGYLLRRWRWFNPRK